MRFSRLRILGFKTFVEPIDFAIQPGLTGVVGPNGCGKSNLVEALRWVMGENSFKNMRASGMDDVIFSGSGQRPARNTAEVMLTLDNAERRAPAQFNDVDVLEVSRRIERESGSTYRINGREVRARDIQILFADASTGARSPALVRQGQIGEIINAKPQARRRILEEAAGVAGLHVRRHEAETRLKAAEANLDRLETVLAQLEQQVETLKRQARQAVRYRALSSDIRKKEAALAFLRLTEAARLLDEAANALAVEESGVAEALARQAAAATAQAVAAHGVPERREAAASAQAAVHRLTVAREQHDAEERRAQDRIGELKRRVAELTAAIAREAQLANDAEAALARLEEERAALAAAGADDGARIAAAMARVLDAEARLAIAERAFAEQTAALADIVARRAQAERMTRDALERVQRLDRQLTDVADERARLEAAADHAGALAALGEAHGAAQGALTAAEAEALAAERALAVARSQEGEARRPLADAERLAQRLETEARTLAKVLNVGAASLWPPVVEEIAVEKGYETALGAALAEDLDAPRSSASPQHWAGAAAVDDPALPEGATPLLSLVTAPPELGRRLAQIGVVERSDGARLRQFLRPGQRLVSREGDIWRWDGFTVAANAPTAAARRLAERNRLADVERELEKARAVLSERRKSVDEAFVVSCAAVSRDEAARAAWRAASRRVEEAREALQARERAAGAVVTRLAALAEAASRLGASRQEAEGVAAEASRALSALPPTAGEEAKLSQVRAVAAEGRATLAEARAAAQGLTRDAEARETRLAALSGEFERWIARRDGGSTQTDALLAKRTAAEAEIASLDDAPARFAALRRALIAEVREAETAQRAAADDLARAEREAADADRAARIALEALTKVREAVARAEARRDGQAQRLAEVEAAVRQSFDVTPAALARLADLDPAAPLPTLAATEAAIETLKRERDRLGGVNLQADDDLKSAQEQFDTLAAERDDLVEAIRKLRAAIGALNREGRERLLASFAVVNGNFQRLFATLFGGGTAELQLIESDDPLEAGLDILAKPPGKRPQTLSLLSGGEQALTAIALIFAVFLTNPAPICVLDEVDAPLDDANVERYCNLLDDMVRTTKTRFLVITHNPITMSRMDRLFGVTMAERGVSTLVSVDLGRAERLLAAE